MDVWINDWLGISFFERLQIVEFAHLEGGRFKFKVHNSTNHALVLRVGGGVGHVRHLVQLSGGQLDTTLEGIGSATLGLSYMYKFGPVMSLVISPDYIQLFGESPSYHLDLNIGLGFSF